MAVWLSDKEKVIKALLRAELLVEQGWTQGAFYDEGKYCLIGAAREAEQEFGLRDTLYLLFKEQLRMENPFMTPLPMVWNDSKTTGQSDVIGLIQRTRKAVLDGNQTTYGRVKE